MVATRNTKRELSNHDYYHLLEAMPNENNQFLAVLWRISGSHGFPSFFFATRLIKLTFIYVLKWSLCMIFCSKWSFSFTLVFVILRNVKVDTSRVRYGGFRLLGNVPLGMME